MVRLGLLLLGGWAAVRLIGKSRQRLTKRHADGRLDEALEETFPASDAPAMSTPASFIGGDLPDKDASKAVH